MNVALTPDVERFVQSKVATGGYRSPDEFVAECVRHVQWIDEARQKIEEGWASAERGELIPGDLAMAEIKARLRKKIDGEESR